jgi:chromosome segregation ATPase
MTVCDQEKIDWKQMNSEMKENNFSGAQVQEEFYHPYEDANGAPIAPQHNVEHDSSDDESLVQEELEDRIEADKEKIAEIQEAEKEEEDEEAEKEESESEPEEAEKEESESEPEEAEKEESESEPEEYEIVEGLIVSLKEEREKRVHLEEIVSKLEHQSALAKSERVQLLGWIKQLGGWMTELDHRVKLVEQIKVYLHDRARNSTM